MILFARSIRHRLSLGVCVCIFICMRFFVLLSKYNRHFVNRFLAELLHDFLCWVSKFSCFDFIFFFCITFKIHVLQCCIARIFTFLTNLNTMWKFKLKFIIRITLLKVHGYLLHSTLKLNWFNSHDVGIRSHFFVKSRIRKKKRKCIYEHWLYWIVIIIKYIQINHFLLCFMYSWFLLKKYTLRKKSH